MSSSNLNGSKISKGQSYWVELNGYFRPDWSYTATIIDQLGGATWTSSNQPVAPGFLGLDLKIAFSVIDANSTVMAGNLTITVNAYGKTCSIAPLYDQSVEY